MSASNKRHTCDEARTRDVSWVLLVDSREATEVCAYRFNLDDAPEHLYDTIKNNLNLTKKVWKYENVYEDGIEGMAGLVIEDPDDDEDENENDGLYEQERAEEALEYMAGKATVQNLYNNPEPHDVYISMVLA